jgi:hypothetical protein
MSGLLDNYSKTSSNGNSFNVQQGQLNKYRVRPAILNEHAESSREIQGVVDATTIVGQVFKASQDNINGLLLTLESAAGTSVDDFESYANSAALQVEWVETDAADPATLETTIVGAGNKAMALPMDATVLDEWVNTISSVDWTNFTFDFQYQQTRPLSVSLMSFFIGDGTNTKSIDLNVVDINSWQHFQVNENAMSVQTEDATASPPNMAAITKIGFRLKDSSGGSTGYVDTIVATTEPGSVDLKLWDMGTTIPVAGVTSIDDGTQYTELGDRGLNGGSVVAAVNLPLIGGKRLYTIKNFVAGVALEIPSNTLLTVGNYYMITINYVDTNVSVFGPDTSFNINYYKNGYAFTVADEATAITAVGQYSDCMFGILSTQDVWINTIVKFYNATPGDDSSESTFIEDKNMVITDIAVGDAVAIQSVEAEFRERKFWCPKGAKFEVYHNDDLTDSVTKFTAIMGYLYVPQEVNG